MKRYEDDDYSYLDEEEINQQPAWRAHEQEFGCSFCYDSRTKKDIEIYFFDRANNMRISTFCPSCGRKF